MHSRNRIARRIEHRLVRSILRLGLGIGLLPLLASPAWAELVNVTLLHLNDVYEITPIEGGRRGGLARVAGLRQQLLTENPNTYTVLAGDAFSPSALGTARVDGERLAGRQMVAVLNALGLDYATFGNHEFDISEEQFLQRLQESSTTWFSANVSDMNGEPFAGVPRSSQIVVAGADGAEVRIGLIGVTLPSNPATYVSYRDPIEAAREQVEQLRGQSDIIVAITHLSLEQDQALVATIPDVDLVLGGHEHENMQQWRIVNPPVGEVCPQSATPIFKADANARTVYVHRLQYDTASGCLQINSQLQEISSAIPDDLPTAVIVQRWQEIGFAGFRQSGFEPGEEIATTTEFLDGLESSVRNHPTNLTQLIAAAMLSQVEGAELALFNSGSIRIDDRLPPGEITQYDVIRILPFGGNILAVDLPGALLQRVLTQGQANQGSGGYLQTANVSTDESGSWLIQGEPLRPEQTYRVAINDFLISGRETGLDYLTLDASGVALVAETTDIRFAVIEQLKTQSESAQLRLPAIETR